MVLALLLLLALEPLVGRLLVLVLVLVLLIVLLLVIVLVMLLMLAVLLVLPILLVLQSGVAALQQASMARVAEQGAKQQGQKEQQLERER
jgi:hypothetical protein